MESNTQSFTHFKNKKKQMTSESLRLSIEKNNFKPIPVWDKLSYSAQLLYCEQIANNNAYSEYPSQVIADALADYIGTGFSEYLQAQVQA